MIIDKITKMAKATRARIAVGAGRDHEEKVIESARKAIDKGYADVVIVSSRPLETDIEHVVAGQPEFKLIELMKKGKVDGVVRGTLDINPIMAALKKEFQVQKILRLAILKTTTGKSFFFAPVGIDDGWTIREKIKLGQYGAELLRKLGISEDIAVLGGGRAGDLGRSKITDKSIKDAENITDALRQKGYQATCAYILIEEAVNNQNFIIAPDGICGNLIYRSLCLVGGGGGMGGPAVAADFVYVDNSRAGARYENAICTASALVGMRGADKKKVGAAKS
ncbi:MAG TPA: phosphotransacetylase [Syntrophus sp. (in: bacteria)]|jgi:putative methanogen marker protein 4|nr:phosphotransacetylase [Syntrophus sp. (in: bacteria)]